MAVASGDETRGLQARMASDPRGIGDNWDNNGRGLGGRGEDINGIRHGVGSVISSMELSVVVAVAKLSVEYD